MDLEDGLRPGAVLLADDDEFVRAVSRDILQAAGYTVMAAADGADAVALFRTRPEAFRIAVLDFAMPHMDGEQTLYELRRLRPNLPVLVCTGYVDTSAAERLTSHGVPILQKPFPPGVLLNAVARLLGR
ncbi:MAG: response regulator [Deltaproteobacteria bacterium]|nr:response regulator [Deltaproteobacteria bacterium]